MSCSLIYITVAHAEEGTAIARALLEERLIACANLLPGITSLYWWEEAIHEGAECVVIAKTTSRNVTSVIARVKELHSYACPCIVTLPIEAGNQDFLHWITEEVHSHA